MCHSLNTSSGLKDICSNKARSHLRQISEMSQNVADNVCLGSFLRQLKCCSFRSHLTTKLFVTSNNPYQSLSVLSLYSTQAFSHIFPSFLCTVNYRTGYRESMWNCIQFASGFLFLSSCNVAQRAILFCITHIQALQAPILMLKFLHLYIIALNGKPQTTALASTSPAHRKDYLRDTTSKGQI